MLLKQCGKRWCSGMPEPYIITAEELVPAFKGLGIDLGQCTVVQANPYWTNMVEADPVYDLRKAIQWVTVRAGRLPSTIIMGVQAMIALSCNPDFSCRLAHSDIAPTLSLPALKRFTGYDVLPIGPLCQWPVEETMKANLAFDVSKLVFVENFVEEPLTVFQTTHTYVIQVLA